MHHFKTRLGVFILGLALIGSGHLSAEVHTLTDKQGRVITAEVLSVDNGQVKIKREDGQVFSLPLDSLSQADQAKVVAAEADKPLAADAIQVDLSRAKFSTSSKDVDVKLTGGSVVPKGQTIVEEKWGYSTMVNNHTPRPIAGLRAEYRLYATVDSVGVAEDKLVLKKKAYTTPIENIPGFGKVTFRTETVTAVQTHFNGNIKATDSGRSSSEERLYGVWMKIMSGDKVVYETSMPPSLSTKQKW